MTKPSGRSSRSSGSKTRALEEKSKIVASEAKKAFLVTADGRY